MKTMKPAAGINQTTSNTVGRVANIAVNFLTWQIIHTKIRYSAFSMSATSPGNTTRKEISQSATSRCGDAMSIRSIRVVTIHFSAI